jgi:hypothetical protein
VVESQVDPPPAFAQLESAPRRARPVGAVGLKEPFEQCGTGSRRRRGEHEGRAELARPARPGHTLQASLWSDPDLVLLVYL